MDIVTHGMMGVVIAAPFMPEYPLASTMFILGNAAPDLDAFSRIFGRRAFLKSHQTWSHAWPIIMLLGVMVSYILYACEWPDWYAGLLLAAGMILHSATDATNTFGISLWAPFTLKRYCVEWVFFIDSVVIAVTIPLFAYAAWCMIQLIPVPSWTVMLYLGLLIPYWGSKWFLRHRVARIGPQEATSFIPSALIPWEFFSSIQTDGGVRLLKINALNGNIISDTTQEVFDDQWQAAIAEIPEYQSMLALSPSYHVISVSSNEQGYHCLKCKDLRVRNFKTSFGELDLIFDQQQQLLDLTFHV